MEINIIDVGIGNPTSVLRMFEELNVHARLVGTPVDLDTDLTDLMIVMPGVGTWDRAVGKLERAGWIEFLQENVTKFRSVLGICLGMQLLFDKSEEGEKPGLSLLDGRIGYFQTTNVINIGWRDVTFDSYSYFTDSRFYHVHRLALIDEGQPYIKGKENSGLPVCVEHKNIVGFQFHPEKSHYYGKKLLKEWLQKYAEKNNSDVIAT